MVNNLDRNHEFRTTVMWEIGDGVRLEVIVPAFNNILFVAVALARRQNIC